MAEPIARLSNEFFNNTYWATIPAPSPTMIPREEMIARNWEQRNQNKNRGNLKKKNPQEEQCTRRNYSIFDIIGKEFPGTIDQEK